jgi:hypothetical protein
MTRRECLSHDKAESPVTGLASGNLRRESQELLVDEALCVKVAEQSRPALDENPLAPADLRHFVEDGARRMRTLASADRSCRCR